MKSVMNGHFSIAFFGAVLKSICTTNANFDNWRHETFGWNIWVEMLTSSLESRMALLIRCESYETMLKACLVISLIESSRASLNNLSIFFIKLFLLVLEIKEKKKKKEREYILISNFIRKTKWVNCYIHCKDLFKANVFFRYFLFQSLNWIGAHFNLWMKRIKKENSSSFSQTSAILI